jgi:peptide methionine sulfoxide reductase MsrB
MASSERSDAEWRAMLSEEEHEILREGGTEFPTSHPLWNDYTEGEFLCRGCDIVHCVNGTSLGRVEPSA